jgi:homoserine kinase
MPSPLGRRRREPAIDALRGREVAVPGSTSNLGPGFDALGLALQVMLRVRVAAAADDGRGALDWRFLDAPLRGENSIAAGFRAGLAAFARDAADIPSMTLEVTSEIPMQAGLGSSAAAFVAGLRLAELVAGPQPTQAILTEAARLEGHPDNTSASVLGGFVVASQTERGDVVAAAADWPSGWPLVVATPGLALETKRARAALPASVPLGDAVSNLQRCARIVAAVHRRDPGLLVDAFVDRLHQPYRAALVPGLTEALQWSFAGLLGTFLSGAGPSIASIADASVPGAVEEARRRFEDLYARLQLPVEIRVLQAHAPIPLRG